MWVLVPGEPFKTSLMFVGKAGPILKSRRKWSVVNKDSTLFCSKLMNGSNKLKCLLQRTHKESLFNEHSSLLDPFIHYKGEKLLWITTVVYFLQNLWMGPIS